MLLVPNMMLMFVSRSERCSMYTTKGKVYARSMQLVTNLKENFHYCCEA